MRQQTWLFTNATGLYVYETRALQISVSSIVNGLQLVLLYTIVNIRLLFLLKPVKAFKEMSDSENEEETKNIPIRNSSSETSYDEDEEEPLKQETPTADRQDDEKTLVQTVQAEDDKMSTSTSVVLPKPRRKRFIPKYEVEGVYKVMLGEETQIQVEIVVGLHVTVQYPWKEVSKAKIMENIEVGGELSDFFSLREKIAAYKEDNILMGFIVDESHNEDEFYICCTKAARDHCKQQSDKFIRRQEKKLQKAVEKKPRPWVSLGSEREIIELIPVNTRNLMELEIKAKFPTEYEPNTFQVRDCNAVRDGYIQLTPYRQKFNNVFQKRVDCASQIAPPLVDKAAQTVLRYPKNMWTQSIADALGKLDDVEGESGDKAKEGKKGDDDDSSEEEDGKAKQVVDEVGIAAYKAAFKRMRRPSYIKKIDGFMTSKHDEINSVVELNTVMDIYCNDYPKLVHQHSTDAYTTMTFEEYVCFTDIRAKDKYVSAAVFHPMWTGIVAISYSDGSPKAMKSVTTRPDPIQRAVYGLNPVMIWSHIDSLLPKLYLESPREVKALSFCPFDENILIGGLINGQIVVWDITHKLESVENVEVLSETREKYKIAMNAHMGWMKPVQNNAVVTATVLSNLMTSHYGPVTDIAWLSPNFIVTPTGKMLPMEKGKTSLQFASCSEDGNILIWNLSVENVNVFEKKKVKKSKRVPNRPAGLLVDVSPYIILDRILQPCYKIVMGTAGQPYILCLQSFAMTPPPLKYTHTPKSSGKGRKYFTCEIIPQDKSEINTSFYSGSQHGDLVKASWEGHEFNTGEVVNSEYCDFIFQCCIHDGVVTCTTKNPLIDGLTLSVGGKIFAIWSDKLLNRPLIWKKRPVRLTDGVWSKYKPSTLFIATSEGDLETWDLLLRSDKPISVQTLSGTMLTHVTLHTLPLTKNIIGISDGNGSFRMYLKPPIFQLESPSYMGRMEALILREVKVMTSFIEWQEKYMLNNPDILMAIKRKEGAHLAEKEEEKRRLREEQERKEEEEAEALRLAKLKVIGPEERWQMIIQKLIERTIAVKKRINRAELIEHEKPLRELEAQRLEKERRMLEIMKNQKVIFNDTVAILFPEAVKKPPKVKKSLLTDNKEALKKEYIQDYDYLKQNAYRTVRENPFKIPFNWDETIAEGKERRQALNAQEDFVKIHKERIETEESPSLPQKSVTVEKAASEVQHYDYSETEMESKQVVVLE